jgi:protein SCO1/2
MIIRNLLPLVLVVILAISIYLMTKEQPKYNKYDGGDFSFNLNTVNGQITNNDFKDKIIILFFGYMNCPDICPTALTDINNALKNLSKDKLKDVQIIFISVDPSRDKLKNLDEYVKYFNKSFIGASSDEKTLKELTARFYAYYSYDEQKNSAVGYTVSHTTRIYLLNQTGKLINTLETNRIKIDLISNSIKELF